MNKKPSGKLFPDDFLCNFALYFFCRRFYNAKGKKVSEWNKI